MEIRYAVVKVPVPHLAPEAEIAVGVIAQGGGEARGRFAADESLYDLVSPVLRRTRFKYLQQIFDKALQEKTLTTTKWEGDETIDANDPRYLELLAERWSDGHVVFSEPQQLQAESLEQGLDKILQEQVLDQSVPTIQGERHLTLTH